MSQKLEADRKLITVLFGIEPLDWCRYDNGNLVYLNQAGQKFTLTPQEINELSDKRLAERDAAKPVQAPKHKPKAETGKDFEYPAGAA